VLERTREQPDVQQEKTRSEWASAHGTAGTNGAKEFDEFFGCAGGERIDGVRNDIRVDVFGEIETNGEAAWAGVLIVVWYGGNTGEVRKPECDGD
jgi:hypothetical protein